MNLFKTTSWKWWELKVLGLGVFALATAFLLQFPKLVEWLTPYNTVVWFLAIALYAITIISWLRK